MTKTAAIQELSRLTAQVYAYHKSGQITDDELAKAQHHINTAADELARGIDPDLAMISTGTIYDLLRKAETRKPDKGQDEPAKKTGAKKASAGMTQEDYDRLYDFVYTKKEKGVITDNETSSFLRFLDELKNGGASAAEAEKALETSIRSTWADGKSAPDAIKAAKAGLKIGTPKSDPGERATDKAVSDLEKQLRKVYNSAKTELTGELKQLEKEYAKELKDKRKKLDDGEISQSEYDAWVRGQLMRQERMKQQIDQCTGTLLNANEKAIAMVNGERLGVFAENANYQSYQINKQADMNLMFSVYDETTAARLIRDNPDLLPPRKVNEKKDRKWNQQRITAAVAQAVIQGDSIPKLAARIAGDAAGANASAMLRYARTAMTGAQNAGRQEMLQQAAAMGIKVKKRWMATLDARTRDSHASMDGETVDIDKRFSNGLMFPGDPNGKPGEVYNCRCTMIYEYDGFKDKAEEALRRDNETGELIRDMTYSEWKKLNAPEPEKQKKTKLEKKIEKATAKDLTEGTKKAIDNYIEGRGNKFTEAQIDEIKAAMETTDSTLYRVEDMYWMADNLEIGDTFTFDKPLKGFTNTTDGVRTVIEEGDDAGLYDGPIVVFETVGDVDRLDITELSRNHEEEAESLVGGTFRVVDEHEGDIYGKDVWIMQIEQVKPGTETTASDFDEIMAKANAMKQSDISDWEEDKKNLLPMADEKLSDQAHRIYMGMSAEEERKRTQAVTLKISDLKTEQAEVFIPRIEELAEAFNGRPVTGIQTDEHDGITVAKWRGEYIVLDGNNRTNLAILKGQTELDVMLIDFDDDSELKAQIEEIVRRSPVEGKDITDTWERRPDDFAFEIEDVISAQGFDGLPKIVDPVEFDKAVKASGFIAQRSYSAPDQETLDAYQDMLYNGKFYVDCGTGGAQYGQGMYCAADYTGKLTRGITEEMAHYKKLGDARYGGKETRADTLARLEKTYGMPPGAAKFAGMNNTDPGYLDFWRSLPNETKKRLPSFRKSVEAAMRGELTQFKPAPSYTETFTLVPGAKIITYDKACKQMVKERTGEEIEEALEWADIKDLIDSDVDLQDVGVWAALHGYDAINAEGHGQSGSYTVILNRSKCIFRRDKR